MTEESDLIRRCRDKLDVDMNEYLDKAKTVGYDNANTIPRISAYLTAISSEAIEGAAERMTQVSAEAKVQADRMENQGGKMLAMTKWLKCLTVVLALLGLFQLVAVMVQVALLLQMK